MATVFNDDLKDLTLRQKHEALQIEPMNVRLQDRLTKLWNRFGDIDEDLYTESMNENRGQLRDHAWWGRAALRYAEDPPPPVYTENRQN